MYYILFLGNKLMRKYERSREVIAVSNSRRGSTLLKLKRPKRAHKKPKRSDLVHLRKSPDFCNRNDRLGIPGITRNASHSNTSLEFETGLLKVSFSFNFQARLVDSATGPKLDMEIATSSAAVAVMTRGKLQLFGSVSVNSDGAATLNAKCVLSRVMFIRASELSCIHFRMD